MFLSSERQSRKFIKFSLILIVNLKGEKNQKQLNTKPDGQRTENVQNIQDTSLCPQSRNKWKQAEEQTKNLSGFILHFKAALKSQFFSLQDGS